MPATAPPPPDLAAKVDALAELMDARLHRLEAYIRSRLAPPARQLTLAQAAKLGFPKRTLQRLIAAGVFTDDRGGKRAGSACKLYEDELKEWRANGEAGVRRLRDELGRT